METFFKWVIGRPKTILAGILLITLFFTFQLSALRIEVSGKSLIHLDHPTILFNNEVEKSFGLRETILVVISHENHPRGIFNPHSLSLLKELTERIKEIEGIVSHEVRSLTTEK